MVIILGCAFVAAYASYCAYKVGRWWQKYFGKPFKR